LNEFIESVDFSEKQEIGRPRSDIQDLTKCLLVMCFNGMSYGRAESDFVELYNKGLIHSIPKISTLNKYVCSKDLTKILNRLIQLFSLVFIDSEDTIICDSTWLGHHMYHGGYHLVYDKEHAPLDKCTKVHIACLKNSKIIAFAKVTDGTKHDSPILKELIMNVINNGFNIKNLLTDAGYSSKANYAFCNHVNISNIFIDFQSRAKLRSDGRTPWMKQLKVFKENPDIWHEKYRYRVVVEGIFSSIKKKHVNYLRSRQTNSRFNELLLKILVYNLMVIVRYF
jgi:hypothetical protein